MSGEPRNVHNKAYVRGSQGFIPDVDSVIETEHIQDSAISSAKLASGVPARTQLPTGCSKISLVDGEDETSTNQITVTGMAAGDEVVTVLVLATKASIATMSAHAGTLTAAAGKITPGTKVNNTNNQYIVFWNDLT